MNFYKASFYSNNNHAAQLPGLQTMLSRLGMEFEGQPHSGLDDAKNIARIGKLFQFHEIFQKKKKFMRLQFHEKNFYYYFILQWCVC